MHRLGWIVVLLICPLAFADGVLNVSASVSLREALEKTADAFKQQENCELTFNFGACGALAVQIEQGSPSDVFISASHKQPDQMAEKKLVDVASEVVVAKNELVLITPAADKSVNSFDDLMHAAVKKIAIGEPKSDPSGDYANQTFEGLKIADEIKPKIMYGSNVRQVLDYVIRGEADAGIVYRTDAIIAADKVRVAAVADETWHKPVEYPGVIVSASSSKDLAKKYLEFLKSDATQEILCRAGFATLQPAKPTSQPVEPSATTQTSARP